MNTQMLKYLVELANGKVDCIDVEKFYQRFPESTSVINDLDKLDNLKFVTLLYGNGKLTEIGVNQSALDYFK